MPGPERRLAAVLFSDIVGYTALMAESEAKGLRARERHRDLLRPLAGRYHGKIVDETGDELLLVFPSDLDAVNCALAAQAALREDPELTLRIGIHAGDVVFEGGRVYGDGVNVASRIRPLAEPGGIAVSEPVFEAIKNQPDVKATPLGEQQLKNIPEPVHAYAVVLADEAPRVAARRPRWHIGLGDDALRVPRRPHSRRARAGHFASARRTSWSRRDRRTGAGGAVGEV